MIIAVFRFIVRAMFAFWIAVALGDFPNQILTAPMNHDDALALGVADKRTKQLNRSDARAAIPCPAL